MADTSKDKELIFKDESGEQLYALVLKSLGSSRFLLLCDDAVERIGKLRGNMRRSQWVSTGCYVLATTRMDDTQKVDITVKYTDIQARQLKRYGELRSFEHQEETSLKGAAADDDLVDFTADDDGDVCIDAL